MTEKKRKEAIAIVESWLGDTTGYDKRVWVKFSRAIERNRLSDRHRVACIAATKTRKA